MPSQGITINPAAMEEGLAKFTVEQLEELILTAQDLLESRKVEERKEALETIRRLAEENNLIVEIKDERGRTRKKKSAPRPAVFRNPSNPEQTWSGRGARPKWFKKALEEGVSEDTMRI